MNKKICSCGVGVILASQLSLSFPAFAKEKAAIEEVVVTARKREESLQETPIAVTAMDADLLRAAQIDELGDLTAVVPGLTRREGRKTADLTIRGVGQNYSGNSVDPGVGVYVDGLFLPRNDSQLVDAINTESIQVLRGPQGTLFGKNTVGGAILFTTKKPGPEAEGFVKANIGDNNRQYLRGSFSGPLVNDSLFGGIVLDSRREDGYREDLFTGYEYGDTDKKSALVQLRYESEGSLTADLMLFWSEQQEMGQPVRCQLTEGINVSDAENIRLFTAAGNSTPVAEACALSEALDDEEKVIQDRIKQPWEMENRMAGLTLEWDVGELMLKSTTGYMWQGNISTGEDQDGTNVLSISNKAELMRHFAANGIALDEERQFFSQEFQVSGSAFDGLFDYTTGIFYSYEDILDSADGDVIGPGGNMGRVQPDGRIFVTQVGSQPSFTTARYSNLNNQSAAIFGQAIVPLSEQWQLTLGGRYTWEQKNAEQWNYVAFPDGSIDDFLTREEFDALENNTVNLAADPVPKDDQTDSWSVFSPAATLSHFLPESVNSDWFNGGMVYLSVAQGFKAGGFASYGTTLTPFDPEELTTYEFGYKLDLLANRVRLNGAIFYSEYEEIQIQITRRVGPGDVRAGIVNAGEAVIEGAEMELTLLPVDAFMVNFSAAYLNAYYKEFEDYNVITGETDDRTKDDFNYLPRTTYSMVMQYDWSTAAGSIVPRLTGQYTDDLFIGTNAGLREIEQAYLDGYSLWNFRLAWQPAMLEGFEVATYVNNLTDEDYDASGYLQINMGIAGIVPGRGRTYGVEFFYDF